MRGEGCTTSYEGRRVHELDVGYDPHVTFRQILQDELSRRKARNRRYSVRRLAQQLCVSHATISRCLRSTRPTSIRTVRTLGARLGMSDAEIEGLVRSETEAAVAAAICSSTFRAESRWLATVTGFTIDGVNVALHSLLRQGRLVMSPRGWQVKGFHNA